jgi:hypothetical protein
MCRSSLKTTLQVSQPGLQFCQLGGKDIPRLRGLLETSPHTLTRLLHLTAQALRLDPQLLGSSFGLCQLTPDLGLRLLEARQLVAERL